jgi:micrococcal nuclease
MKPTNLYHYKAYVTRVYSGESCIVDIDLGLDVWTRGREIRFHRIQAPASTGNGKQAAQEARDFLRSLILDREVLLRTVKDRTGKSKSLPAEMVVVTESGEIINVNEALVAAGHAVLTDT